MLLEQRLAVVAEWLSALELTPTGISQAVMNGPLRRHFVVTGRSSTFPAGSDRRTWNGAATGATTNQRPAPGWWVVLCRQAALYNRRRT